MRTFILALAAVVTLTSIARAADWTVASRSDNVPFEYQDPSGASVGFEVDVIDAVARRLGKTVEYTPFPFNGLFAAVQSGRALMAISSITITPQRLETVGFAQPYYDGDQCLAVRRSGPVHGLKDLKGRAIGVETGSTGDVWATQHAAELGVSDVRRYDGLGQAMLDLQAERIDGYIFDIPNVRYFVKDKPQLEVAERIPTGERYSVMFAKGSPLIPEVNAQITALKQDGTLARLHEKWFGTAPEAGSSTGTVEPVPVAAAR